MSRNKQDKKIYIKGVFIYERLWDNIKIWSLLIADTMYLNEWTYFLWILFAKRKTLILDILSVGGRNQNRKYMW